MRCSLSEATDLSLLETYFELAPDTETFLRRVDQRE